MISLGIIFILLAYILQYFDEKVTTKPVSNIRFWTGLCKVFGIVSIIIGFFLIFLFIILCFTGTLAGLAAL